MYVCECGCGLGDWRVCVYIHADHSRYFCDTCSARVNNGEVQGSEAQQNMSPICPFISLSLSLSLSIYIYISECVCVYECVGGWVCIFAYIFVHNVYQICMYVCMYVSARSRAARQNSMTRC